MKTWKTIADLLQENPSLKEKHTYEEFREKKMTPENSDDYIDEVFDEFDRFISRREKEHA